MIQSKKALILALMIPIVSLAALVAYRQYLLTVGHEVILPITGCDPRDLLSGHYLMYQIEYGVGGLCSGNFKQPPRTAFVCLEPKMFSYSVPDNCRILIRGVCHNTRFEAGIEKFYVPDDKAKALESQMRVKKPSIVLSITPTGQAHVKDLLFDGKSWNSP